VRPQTLWRLGNAYAAVVWSDRRLTVIDVRSGRRWEAGLPDHGITNADIPGYVTSDLAVYGLGRTDGEPALVAVVQRGAVGTYEMRTGRPAWSHALPADEAVLDPVQEAQSAGTTLLLNLSTDRLGAYTRTGSIVLDSGGRVTMRLTTAQTTLQLGGDRIALQVGGSNLQIYDGRTGRGLYQLTGAGSPYIAAGGGLVLTQDQLDGPLTAHRSGDGATLWRESFSGDGPQAGPGDGLAVRDLAVYGGEPRILQVYSPPEGSCGPRYRVLTLSPSGSVKGIKPLPAFDCRAAPVSPSFVDGRDGVLIVKDNSSIRDGARDRYVLEAG
jgi:hypothetical protein